MRENEDEGNPFKKIKVDKMNAENLKMMNHCNRNPIYHQPNVFPIQNSFNFSTLNFINPAFSMQIDPFIKESNSVLAQQYMNHQYMMNQAILNRLYMNSMMYSPSCFQQQQNN